MPSPRVPFLESLLILIFAVLLALPTVDFFTGIDITGAPSENRLPAPRPRLTQANFAGVQRYLAASEAYFNDHFGFRKRLIRWYQQWKIRLYRDQGVVMNRVVSGQDGWLFYGEDRMVDHYLCIAKFSPEQLQAWRNLLEKRRDWLAARGIEYLFVIPPDKQNVYSEKLPVWLLKAAPPHRQTKLDQLMEYMKAHSTVAILDLRRPLLEAKTTLPTYQQTDTHWNGYGAFVACQEIIKTLAPEIPGLPPLRSADFTWSNRPFPGGDLARMLGVKEAEKNYFVFTPRFPDTAPSLRAAPELVSMYGSHNTNMISQSAGLLSATAVVFHDSFGAWWRPILGYSFKRVIFMWDDREFNAGVIAANHPQVVINEMLERFVNTMDPAEMMARDALP